MSRKNYNNGDEVGLEQNGCDGCSPSVINGVFCHEHGCPDAWRDRKIACGECGCDFYPTERYQSVCDDCQDYDDEEEDWGWDDYYDDV